MKVNRKIWSLFDRIRFRVAKLIYDGFIFFTVRDQSWQEPLFASLAPQANDRILHFGTASSSTAVTLACRFSEATFVGTDPNWKAVEKAKLSIARRQICNVTVMPLEGRLSFEGGSFDKIVCVLTFHNRLPEEKVGIAKEMLRVLRHGGTLHVVDFDQPVAPGERAILSFARYLSGPLAAESHMNGSWTRFLAKAGFVGIRCQSSQSLGVGRVSVVKARKR